jgi:putative transcriptional regulator
MKLKRARVALAALLLLACAARAQPAAVVLVAKPALVDPNFRETVVLVTHTPRGETIGVVLNRPGGARLDEVAPQFPHADAYREPLYRGGPVLPGVIVALFRSANAPDASAFEVASGAYLTLHPRIIDALLGGASGRFRLFAGFCGWAPGQLEAEIAADSWYVLPASEALLFRSDAAGLWRELLEKARGQHAGDKARRSRGIYLPG